MERALTVDGQSPDPQRVDEGLSVFRDHYSRHCLDNTQPYPGVLATLAHFHRLPLFVATNKPRDFTMQILEGLHLDGAFGRIVAGDDVDVRKPAPDQLVMCLEGTGIDPQEAAMVGDHANDINAAKACGAVSVGATFGLSSVGEMKAAGPDLVIDDFTQLKDCFTARDSL
jgi:phosphoglycolate phosphatase